MSPRELTELIKSKAHELGFQHVGIARAEALTEEAADFQEWLNRGYHASMGWMERNIERRSDPRNILSGAKSIVCVAMNYYSPVQHSAAAGKVSRYAWGDDYHDVVGEKLEQLLEYAKSLSPDLEGKVYVDTGPVLEKAWAQRAGIGWIGKHTNLISQEYGSWIFLGEMILNQELLYDTPATDHCGTCTLCIEACPTDAITQEYVVDSNRCISYLTIEHRGDIPVEFNGKFDNWVYGCDICQDVCPWNHKFSQETGKPEFQPRPHNVAPSLEAWSHMSEQEFQSNFRGSAMKRTKLTGIRRNAKWLL